MKKTVKKFSVADKLQVKRKIFNIVTDIEGKYVGEQQPQRSFEQHSQNRQHRFTSFPQTNQEQFFDLQPNTKQQFVS